VPISAALNAVVQHLAAEGNPVVEEEGLESPIGLGDEPDDDSR